MIGTLFGLLSDMPKRTYQPKKRRAVKTHGFRARMKSPSGKNVLRRRRHKGRRRLVVGRKTK
jgi:large subunit ribosomal protein L34